MTREEYQEHKEDYESSQLSAGAFVLFQAVYISTLEQVLKAKNEVIERLEEAIKMLQPRPFLNSDIN